MRPENVALPCPANCVRNKKDGVRLVGLFLLCVEHDKTRYMISLVSVGKVEILTLRC